MIIFKSESEILCSGVEVLSVPYCVTRRAEYSSVQGINTTRFSSVRERERERSGSLLSVKS